MTLDVGKDYHVYVQFTESPVRFWVQLADASPQLEELDMQIEDYIKTSGLQELRPQDCEVGKLWNILIRGIRTRGLLP